jgi:hypothetical protein
VNGPPTEREHNALAARVLQNEKDIQALKEWRAQAKLISSVLGAIAGLFAAALVTAIVRVVVG